MKINLQVTESETKTLDVHGRTEFTWFYTKSGLFDYYVASNVEGIPEEKESGRASQIKNPVNGVDLYVLFDGFFYRATVSGSTAKSQEQNARDWERRKAKMNGDSVSTSRKQTVSQSATHEIISENGEVIDRVTVVDSKIVDSKVYELRDSVVLVDGEDYGLSLKEIVEFNPKKELENLTNDLRRLVTARSQRALFELGFDKALNLCAAGKFQESKEVLLDHSIFGFTSNEFTGSDCQIRFDRLNGFLSLILDSQEKKLPMKLISARIGKYLVSLTETNTENQTKTEDQTEIQAEQVLPQPEDFGLPELEPANDLVGGNPTLEINSVEVRGSDFGSVVELVTQSEETSEKKTKKGSRKTKKG